MQDKARLFAYSTWAIMISLAIILFTNRFLTFVAQPGWEGLVVLLVFGFVYMNLVFTVVKRYIRKVPAPTQLHNLLGVLVFLPPACWIVISATAISTDEILILAVLVLACGLGIYFGNRAGIRARYEYIQKLKEYQEKQAEKK